MKVVFQVFAALTILLTANPVAAQTGYPNRQVRIIVGFTPGTAPDVAARLLAAKFSDSWGVPVTVEDITGAGSNIATDRRRQIDTGRLHLADGRKSIARHQSQPV